MLSSDDRFLPYVGDNEVGGRNVEILHSFKRSVNDLTLLHRARRSDHLKSGNKRK